MKQVRLIDRGREHEAVVGRVAGAELERATPFATRIRKGRSSEHDEERGRPDRLLREHFVAYDRAAPRSVAYAARMRFVVYGTGAIGGVTAALLARAGHDVIAIARGAHHDAIAKRRSARRDSRRDVRREAARRRSSGAHRVARGRCRAARA